MLLLNQYFFKFIFQIGYRKHGHNEIDSPYFTQPTLYQIIDKKDNLLKIYEDKLLKEKILTEDEIKQVDNATSERLQKAYDSKDKYEANNEWQSADWANIKTPNEYSRVRYTGIDRELIQELGKRIATVPKDFHLHKNIQKIYDTRMEMAKTGKNIDWGMAELMAYGSVYFI